MKKGIMIAGNILTDTVKTIRSYPSPGMLATIEAEERAVGGCVPNTVLNLARMGSGIPLAAAGCVGKDEAGDFVIGQLRQGGVNVERVKLCDGLATSYSDAMNALDTGERTFFHYRGANAAFAPKDLPPDSLDCQLLHIGYILLLDQFDKPDDKYGTVMARYLHQVQQQGIRTSIDVVSDKEGRFAEKVRPVLPYCDYAIMNELEGGLVSGLICRDANGRPNREAIVQSLEFMMNCGVKRRTVIHCPEAGFCMDAQSGLTVVPSLDLPMGYIQGSVGAGDAFCAGCLHDIYYDSSAKEMLEYASAAAAANLSARDSISGMKPEKEIREMAKTWQRQPMEAC